MSEVPGYGFVFLAGLVVGGLVLPTFTAWELQLVQRDAQDQSEIERSAIDQTAALPSPAPAGARPGAILGSQEATAVTAPELDALPTANAVPVAVLRDLASFDDPDQPPVDAPPPHLTEAGFDSLFEVQDQIDERLESLAVMIADMERDGLPEDHIAFMKEALLAEESIDDGSFETLLDEPEPTYEEREADIVESYSEAGASPEQIDEMLEVLREGFESAEDPAADWDLHNPPVPLD